MADLEDGTEEDAIERSSPTAESVRGSLRSQNRSQAAVKSTESTDRRSIPVERIASRKNTENRSMDIVTNTQEEFSGGKSMVELTQEERTSRRSQRSKGRSLKGEEDLDVPNKDVKLLPKAKTSSRLTTSVQQQNQRRFREMIGKRELRNEELGKQKGNLRQRLDLLECSVPAVMLWNVWRMAQGAPVSSIQRVMKKQFLGPGSGEAYCPSTPSRHFDCRVREAEADRKLAEKRASDARSVLGEKQKLLDAKKQKLEEAKRIQQERQERIEQLTKEAKELKERTKDLQEEDGSCIAGECGEVECKRRLLARMSSSTSIKSSDVECLEKLQQLAESELMMKRQIEDLERREETYMKTLQQADDLWTKVEGDTASTMSALQQLLDVKAARIDQLENELQDQLNKSTIYKSELEKYVSVEKIEAAIGRDGDLAQVQDKSTAAKVKLKHRIIGREWDLAGVDEKETLARVLGKDEGVSAVITQSESSSHARPELADLGTDIPDDLVVKIHARMGITSEEFPPEERYRQAMFYLDQIGSLSKLYDEDDWNICDPEHACQQDETLTENEQLITVTSLASAKTGESFHGKTSKDIGLAPEGRNLGGTRSSGKSDLSQVRFTTKDEKPSRRILQGKDSSRILENGPGRNKLRSWLETTNAIRSTIKTCPDCHVIMNEVDALARDIATYTSSEGKSEEESAVREPKVEAEMKIELAEKIEVSRKSKEKRVNGEEESRADELKTSNKSDIPLGEASKLQDSDGAVRKPEKLGPAISIVKEHPVGSPASQKEVQQLDKVPVKETASLLEVASPAVKEIAVGRREDSLTIRETAQEPQMVPVPVQETKEVTSAGVKDISRGRLEKSPTRLEQVKEPEKLQEVSEVNKSVEIAKEVPSEPSAKSTGQVEVQKSFKVVSDEVTEVSVVHKVAEQVSSSMEKVVEPPPTPTDLKARAAASVTSTPEEIVSRLEQHLKMPEEKPVLEPTVTSDIIKDVINEEDARVVKALQESKNFEEVRAVQPPEVLSLPEKMSDSTLNKTLQESTIVKELPEESVPKIFAIVKEEPVSKTSATQDEVELAVLKEVEGPHEIQKVEHPLEIPATKPDDLQVIKVESDLEELQIIEPEKPEIIVVENEPKELEIPMKEDQPKVLKIGEVEDKVIEPLPPKLSKVIEEEESELKYREAYKRMEKLLTGPEVAGKPYLSVADIDIPVPDMSQPELREPCPCNVLELGPPPRELAKLAEKATTEIVTETSESIGTQTIPVQKVIKRLDGTEVTTYPEPLRAQVPTPATHHLQDQSTITVSTIGIQTEPYTHPTSAVLKAEAELRSIHYSIKPSQVHKLDCTCCVCALKDSALRARPQPPPSEVPLASKMPIMLLSAPNPQPLPLRTDQEFLHERLCMDCKIKRLSRQRLVSSRLKSSGKESCESASCVCPKQHHENFLCARIPGEMRDQSSMTTIPKPTPKQRSKWKEPSIDRVDITSKDSSLDDCICYDSSTSKKLACKCGDPFMYGVGV